MEEKTGFNKELLYQLVDHVKDYAIFVSDLEGRVVSWNAGAAKIFGYRAQEIIGQSNSLLFTEEDRRNGVPEDEMRIAREEGCAEDERWHVRKDGSYFFASGVQTPLYDKAGTHTAYAKIARDLTNRIRLEEALHTAKEDLEVQVRRRTSELAEANESLRSEVGERAESEKVRIALLRKIVQTQEDERKRIARDIHDHIGQQMTGLQLKLHLLCSRYEKDPELIEQLRELKAIAKEIDSEVDFLVWDLRPLVLDDLGLEAALKNFVRDWSEHFGVPAEFQEIGLNGRKLLPAMEINLFRIGQEALNNISKHAGANNVSVLLEKRDDNLSLIVEDDGIGFNPSKPPLPAANMRGMGLLGMKERAELLGGSIEIESALGKGTTIYVRVPARFGG